MQNNQIDLSGFEHPVIVQPGIDGWMRDLNTAAYLLVDTPAGEEERLVVMGNDINNGAYQDFAVLPGYVYELSYKLAFGGSGTMNLKVNEGTTTIASDSKTTNGSYMLNFTPTASTVRVHYAGNVKFMLNYIQLEYSHTDTIVTVSSPMAGYRYGFNGMEKDYEAKGKGNSYTTEFRQYDSRLGRWLSIDPLFSNFPWQSPYVGFDNNPILLVDPKGLAAQNGNDGDPPKENESEPEYKNIPEVTVTGNRPPEYDIIKDTRERMINNINNYLIPQPKELNESPKQSSSAYWWLLTTNGVLGTLSSGVDETLGKMKANKQWQFTKNNLTPYAKKLKLESLGSTNKIFKKIVKPTLKIAKTGTKKIPGLGIIITVGDMSIQQEIKPSHVLDLTVAGVGVIPVFGWIVAGVYIIADGVTYATTGKTIGDHLDEVGPGNLRPIEPLNSKEIMKVFNSSGIKW